MEDPAAEPTPVRPPGATDYDWTRVQWLVAEANRVFELREEPEDAMTWQAQTSPTDVSTLVLTMRLRPSSEAALSAIDPAQREPRYLSMRDGDAERMIAALRILTDRHEMSDWPLAEIRTAPPATLPDVPVHLSRVRVEQWPALHADGAFEGFVWSTDPADVPLTEP